MGGKGHLMRNSGGIYLDKESLSSGTPFKHWIVEFM